MSEALERSGRAALARGDWTATRRIADALLQGNDPAEGHFLAALAEAEAGRVSAALPHLARATELRPSAEYLAQLARLLIGARRDAEARVAAAKAEALGPSDPLTLDTIGCVRARLGDHADAVRLFEAAVKGAPDHLEHRYNLATALSFVGRVDEAEAAFEALIARAPGHGRAHYGLSGLRRHSAERNHVARLEAALGGAQAAEDRLRIRYALAKEYEELGQAGPAFRHLKAANDEHRTRIGYDFAQDEAIFDAIEALFGGADPLFGQGVTDRAPIFIVGMPRTGTTLVDRILSSHPAVESAGELQAMPLAVKQVAASGTRRIIDPETLAATRRADAGEIGRLYLSRARNHLRGAAPHFTDKLPANFLYLGFIARALPGARIVCLRRNPLDTVWSNYKNLFASTSPYYFYSYDLADTARYYLRFDRMMRFWRERLGDRLLELSYETLVDHQEAETRRLLAHCRLDWSDACLSFHENKAAVATPSAAQVRRPLNRDAVGRWRAYESELAPARALFEASGIGIA